MSILQYPELGYFHIASSDTLELGKYELSVSGDLALAHLRILNRNANTFNYQLRLVLSQRLSGPALAVSNWEIFNNEILGQDSEFWMGDLTFTFEDYSVKENDPYYLRLESTGYTRSGESVYMGVWADWGFGDETIVPVGVADSGGARVALGVKQ